ncbi:YXWGXW repeat-containing protein [bacterium]|nr:YXWGXW repeat-containing protein [bacterium]
MSRLSWVVLALALLAWTGCKKSEPRPDEGEKRETTPASGDPKNTPAPAPAPTPAPAPAPAPPPTKPPAPAPAPAPSPDVTEESPFDTTAPEAPPAQRAETPKLADRPQDAVWLHGHWAFNGKWIWISGHWHVSHPGRVWLAGRWEAKAGRWRWVKGSWVDEASQPEERPGLLVTREDPPAPLADAAQVELRPSPRHVWIGGHWAWHGHWVWIHGHWQEPKAGRAWVSGHWDARGEEWYWVSGHWRS